MFPLQLSLSSEHSQGEMSSPYVLVALVKTIKSTVDPFPNPRNQQPFKTQWLLRLRALPLLTELRTQTEPGPWGLVFVRHQHPYS